MSHVPCKHWSDCGACGAGCCAKGLYGGKPSVGLCKVCEDYKGPSRGLGDTIAKFTAAIGINPCRKCKARQLKANAAIPFGGKESSNG